MRSWLLAISSVILISCGPSYINRINTAANAALSELLEGYKRDGRACIANSETRLEAETCIAGVEKRWNEVWRLWDQLKATSNWCQFVTELELRGIVVRPIPEVPCK